MANTLALAQAGLELFSRRLLMRIEQETLADDATGRAGEETDGDSGASASFKPSPMAPAD